MIFGLENLPIDPIKFGEIIEGDFRGRKDLEEFKFSRRRDFWVLPVYNDSEHINFSSSRVYTVCEDGKTREVLGVIRGKVLRDYSQKQIGKSGEAA